MRKTYERKYRLSSNTGITLIALIITIIVLLILAGVTLSMVLGDNGLINKAQSSVDKYKESANNEQELLNSIEQYIDSKGQSATELTLSETSGTCIYPNTLSFTVTNNPSGGALSVTSNAPDVAIASISGNTVTVTPGTTAGKATITVKSAATSNYNEKTATYEATVQNGTISVTATPYTGTYDGQEHDAITVTTDPSDAKIEYSKDGTNYSTTVPTVKNATSYTIYIRVSKVGYKTETVTYTATVNSGEVTVTATQIAAAPQTYYGAEVKNYTAGGATWRIFYVDTTGKYGTKNTIYLKADPINISSLGESYTDTTVLAKVNPMWWSQRGSAKIYWNKNERCTAWMCDPGNWTDYKASSANWAIGGPSIEMYIDSYNNTHSSGKLNRKYMTQVHDGAYDNAAIPGYASESGKVAWSVVLGDYNGIYSDFGYEKRGKGWNLASPSCGGPTAMVYHAEWSSYVGPKNNYDGKECVSPVASLTANFTATVLLY